jgi:ABC-type Fe3+-hydroxamate transport system substrate-binding protein
MCSARSRYRRTLGAALGLEDRAAELDASYRARVDETIAGLPDVRPSMNAVRVFAPNDVWVQAHWLMDDIGLPREAPAPPELFLDVSDENLDVADADILFVSGDGGQEASLAALESNPLWADLTAVKNGGVRLVDDQPWGPTTRTRRSSRSSTSSKRRSRITQPPTAADRTVACCGGLAGERSFGGGAGQGRWR